MSDILTAPSFLTCQRKTTIVITFLQMETHYQLCRSSGNLPETGSQAPAFRTQCLSLSPNCTWLMCSPISSNMGTEPHPPCQVSETQDNPLSPSPSPLDSNIHCCQSDHLWPWPWIDYFAGPPCLPVWLRYHSLCSDRSLGELTKQPARAHRADWKAIPVSVKKNTPTLRILSCYQGFASCSRAVFKTSPWYLHRYMGLFKVLWGSLWKVCIKVLVLLEGLYKRC